MDRPRQLDSMEGVLGLEVGRDRLLSATHEEILSGATTDVYFVKTLDLLRACGCADRPVAAEVFAREKGIFAGLPEVLALFRGRLLPRNDRGFLRAAFLVHPFQSKPGPEVTEREHEQQDCRPADEPQQPRGP